MFKIIEKYINNLNKEDLFTLASKNGIDLSDQELDFSYTFIKKNWEIFLNNPSSLNLDNYKDYYSKENLIKIKILYAKLFNKYSKYL
ncbi:MAG: hypothetical protein R3Y13_02425 [bacterium]